MICKVVKIPYGEKDHPSKAMRIFEGSVMGGDPRAFQQDMHFPYVSSPSSTIVW